MWIIEIMHDLHLALELTYINAYSLVAVPMVFMYSFLLLSAYHNPLPHDTLRRPDYVR